ncbi:hypothetical protein GCM10009737_35550 [Nocardioides lentus]|uniref:PAP2 superfamily protein n=1 Tax=Nocardioides lentus TaxID=338077 RepID=A0ABP5B4E7_9ACTN
MTPAVRPTRVLTVAVALLLVLTGCGGGPGPQEPDPEQVAVPAGVDADDPVLGWFEVTAVAADALGSPVQSPRSALWATAWSAGEAAVDAVGTAGPEAAAPAGFAQAVHDVLVDRVPVVAEAADAQLAATLDAVAEVVTTAERDRAAALGARVADGVLARRAGDGLSAAEVAVGADSFVPRGGPGAWVPTDPGTAPSQPALGRARPFLVTPGRVAVPAPPALGSPAYRADLAEVRALGAADSPTRTAAQTETALFWADDSLSAWTQVLRGLLAARPEQPLEQRVHLVAVLHQVTTDAQIACFAAKYDVQRWRPVTAIREAAPDGTADPDGDPATMPDATWEPLLTTPSHPEFPSAHTVYAGAAEVVLDALVGAPSEPVRIRVDGLPPRDYTDWTDLVEENVEARVASGIHYRTSDEAGAALGRAVARAALSVLARPARG